MPITVSGFGTGALTMTNTDQAEFNRVNQAAGVGKDARPGVDSNLGLQATAKISDSVSFTAQGLVRKNGNNDQFGAEPGPSPRSASTTTSRCAWAALACRCT
jgi:hypothetical protein